MEDCIKGRKDAALATRCQKLFRNPIIPKVVLIIISILFALFVSELLLRFFWTPWSLRSDPAFEQHPVYGFAPIPGQAGIHETPEYKHRFHHTRQGWRGNQLFASNAEKRRILFLGDSFTYGLGANDDQIFVGLFQKNYPQMEFANTGCNAYGTRNEIAVLRTFGAAFKPQVTLLIFFWNDLSDNIRRNKPDFFLDENQQIQFTDPVPPSFDPMELQTQHSIFTQNPWKMIYLSDLLNEGLKKIRYRYFGKKTNFVSTEFQLEQAWHVAGQLFSIVKKSAEEIKTELLVISLPDHNQVNPNAAIKNITPLQYDIQVRLGALCDRTGIQFFDLLPKMKKEWVKTRQDYYYYMDRHLTPEGNRLVYNLIRDRIGNYLQ